MPPQAKPRSPRATKAQQGLLLVEAVLASLVIATGLVFITRGLSTNLRTIQAVQDYDELVAMGRSRLLELETERTAGRISDLAQDGSFPAPYQVFHWSIQSRRIDPEDEHSPVAITLTVNRTDRGSSANKLYAIWPYTWVPNEWL